MWTPPPLIDGESSQGIVGGEGFVFVCNRCTFLLVRRPGVQANQMPIKSCWLIQCTWWMRFCISPLDLHMWGSTRLLQPRKCQLQWLRLIKRWKKFTNDVMFWIVELEIASQEKTTAMLPTILTNNSSPSWVISFLGGFWHFFNNQSLGSVFVTMLVSTFMSIYK